MTIGGADGVTVLLLKLLLVVEVLVTLHEMGTGILLHGTDCSGPDIPLLEADVDGSVETGVTITLLDACWIPAVVVITEDAAMAGAEAIVIRGGGTIFIGCCGCCS